MGNTVSAHIYEIKVFRPYPVILYRLRLDHSIHWWKKIGVPRNDPALDGKASTHVRRNAHLKSMGLISTKLRSLDPTLLYCIDSTGPLYPLVEKNWCPSEQPKLVTRW